MKGEWKRFDRLCRKLNLTMRTASRYHATWPEEIERLKLRRLFERVTGHDLTFWRISTAG